jgi:hypothetical protein
MLEPSPEDPRRFQPKVRFDGSGIEFEAVCLITWDINLLLIAVQPFEAHLPAPDMAMAGTLCSAVRPKKLHLAQSELSIHLRGRPAQRV